MNLDSNVKPVFSMTPDQIFVTDMGTDQRKRALYWLFIGRYVYDHNFNEITLRHVEQEIDPNDTMNPVMLRGALWKTVDTKLWQVDDGHQLGPMPSQPGLDARVSSIYYGDRRTRQGHVMQTPVHHGARARQRFPKDRRQMRSKPAEKIPGLEDAEHDYSCYRALDSNAPEPSCSEHGKNTAEVHALNDSALCQGVLSPEDIEQMRPEHARKISIGPDSGIDIGSIDERTDSEADESTWSDKQEGWEHILLRRASMP